ncbi:MAG: type II toxin-antitoxin system RelE/ParE family toxin [Candidatus Omnitrophica bacterium]|nr:type II toxin-antitoxin system RelE/ParE family toxin [Candidatus Omnitrophota bacterium]
MAGNYIYYQGERFQVEFYYDEYGNIPALELIKALPINIKLKLGALVKLMAEEGQIHDENKFRIVDKNEKIYEFKPMHYRFFNFYFEGGKIIITNGYRKKTQKSDKKELAKSIKMRYRYLERNKRGVYYG